MALLKKTQQLLLSTFIASVTVLTFAGSTNTQLTKSEMVNLNNDNNSPCTYEFPWNEPVNNLDDTTESNPFVC